jgi:hypothetical protein
MNLGVSACDRISQRLSEVERGVIDLTEELSGVTTRVWVARSVANDRKQRPRGRNSGALQTRDFLDERRVTVRRAAECLAETGFSSLSH